MPKKETFMLAIMQDEDGNMYPVGTMPEQFDERNPTASKGEIEYILHRVVFQLQAERIAADVANRLTPERDDVANRIAGALKRRKESPEQTT
jgi:hypothetical protein